MNDQPARGTALYNPQILNREELVTGFVIRTEELERLLDDLRSRSETTPQHHLILGQRGAGKTTLLHRIAYAIEEEDELKSRYFPLTFPEEQYNIRGLGDVWLNCLDAISDTLDRRGHEDAAQRVDAIVNGLSPVDPDLEHKARAALLDQAEVLGRRLVLLVDNADLVFSRIGDDDWSFREVLQSNDDLVIIGASSSAMEATFSYEQAFYDFFDITRLSGLTFEETTRLLTSLAERTGRAHVAEMVELHPERIRPIRNLSGGNPRTLAALFDVLSTEDDLSSQHVLESLLDRYTPLYKARFEALASQTQTVVDTICRAWDPVTAAEVAAETGLKVNAASAQLDRLVTSGLVEKVQSVDRVSGEVSRRHAFQIAERFFNIWYLMRTGRRLRRRLIWYVKFLESFYGSRAKYTAGGRLAVKLQDGQEVDLTLGFALLDRMRLGATRSQLMLALANAAAPAHREVLDQLADDEERSLLRAAESARQARDAETHVDEELLDGFLSSPTASWDAKLSATSDPELLRILGPTIGDIDGFLTSLVGQVPNFIHAAVSSGLDISDPAVEKVSRPLTQRRRAELEEWRAIVTDARLMTPAMMLYTLSFSRHWRIYGEMYGDFPVDGVVELARRRPEWIVPIYLALLASETSGADEVLRDWLPRTSEDGAWELAKYLAFQPAARFGLAAMVRDRMDRVGLTEVWRPAREALHAVALGSTQVLQSLAPEVREPAAELFHEWLSESETADSNG